MIMHRADQALAIRALKNAAPYIRMYKGKIFVVKAGGGVFGDIASTRVLIEQIGILHYFGVRVVLVHGGGPQLTELSDALGVSTRMVQGRRVTDAKTIDVTSMVLNGLINTRILAICRDLNIDAVGISGVDAGLVRAHGTSLPAAEAERRLKVPVLDSVAVTVGHALRLAGYGGVRPEKNRGCISAGRRRGGQGTDWPADAEVPGHCRRR